MREKELRLALICYGGVSLAVYMHGVTREIWHLLRASRSFHDGLDPSPGCEAIYRDIMADMAAKSGLKIRVLADIIAGSSAGGINGIFLSQAIVTGQSLEPLTDLWLETADVDTLLDPDARPVVARSIAPWLKRPGKRLRQSFRASCGRAGSRLHSEAMCFRNCCSTRSMQWLLEVLASGSCQRPSRLTCS
jgi:patatin-related protein